MYFTNNHKNNIQNSRSCYKLKNVIKQFSMFTNITDLASLFYLLPITNTLQHCTRVLVHSDS